jgi:hypothetical protein
MRKDMAEAMEVAMEAVITAVGTMEAVITVVGTIEAVITVVVMEGITVGEATHTSIGTGARMKIDLPTNTTS